MAVRSSGLAQPVTINTRLDLFMQQRMPGQTGESAKIALRAGIGGADLEYGAAGQAIELELGFEQGQRAVQPAGVEFGIEGRCVCHHQLLIGRLGYPSRRNPGQRGSWPATVTPLPPESLECMNVLRPTLLTLACLFAAHTGASDLPSLGDASSSIVSPQQEHQLGRAWLGLLRGQVSQLDDPQLKDFVESSVYRLSETSQLQDRRLEFVLLHSPQLDAFAAPGGIVGVNGGLFLDAQPEAAYASVMAHELAHLSQRHFARGVEAEQRMQLPLMAAMLAGIVAAAAGAGDAGIATIMSTQAAAIQEQRRFSRQNEQEADRIGLVNLEKAGYDPRAMPLMFERLMRQYRYDAKPPEFLLTHPVSESRIADTRNRAEQYPAKGRED